MRRTMGDTLKLLLLLCAVTAVNTKIGRPYLFTRYIQDSRICPEGNYNFKGSCFSCTPCGSFMYEQKSCSPTSNTVCGWCGKKPDLDEISDEVMASYQTKCLMSSLGFIGMTKLKDEFIDVYDNEPKLKVKLIEGKRHKGTSTDDHFQIAKDALFNLDDSQEQELPDPTLEEGKDDDSSIDKADLVSGEELSDEELIQVKIEEKRKEQSEEAIEITSDEDKTEEVSAEKEDLMENEISDQVKAFLIKKGKVDKDEPEEWEVNPYLKGATIVSLKEVQEKFDNFGPQLPIVRSQDLERFTALDEDESNERDIKWDKWVDDKVKPIEESVEIVEAEDDLTQKFEVYEKLPKKLAEKAEQELINFFGRKEELSDFAAPLRPHWPVMIFAMAILLTTTVLALIVVIRLGSRHESFTGVPTDAQDYHMIIDSCKHIEELEKKEQKASRHVHVNPVFDV